MKRRIFVFGSNLAGMHGAGAALCAMERHGAVYGVGEGLTGDAYALPTKDEHIGDRKWKDIVTSVQRFCDFAAAHPELRFDVTRVGCGLAGYTDKVMAPLFVTVWPLDNVSLPWEWWTYMPYPGEAAFPLHLVP